MDRARVLGRLARLAAAGDPGQSLAVRLCGASSVMVGGRGSSISINTGDRSHRLTLAATDGISAQLENLQEVLGEGPCWNAYYENQPVVADLRDGAAELWPAFTRSAREAAGEITVHCYPMRPSGRPFGVLSVYADDVLTEPADVVQFLADTVGAAVLTDPASRDAPDVWATRSVVHQATGMVVAQLRIPPDDALAIIRAHAFAHGTTVAEIADEIVNRRLDFRERT